MLAPRQPGPSLCTPTAPVVVAGVGRGRGATGDRGRAPSPLGEPAVAVRGHSDRRRARASFPPGDSLFSELAQQASDQGGAQVGGSRGEGRGGGKGGLGVPTGPASTERGCRRPGARRDAFCTIVALATVSCRRRFPECSDHAVASDASTR